MFKIHFMSIEVINISKSYGDQKALDAVSFSVKKGEIVGFLGPNGAGKSTLMKILTTYITADEGSAAVNGFDVTSNQKSVQLSVGYLPEHNPLYLDLYVREYLAFNADVFKVEKSRINDVIELTGLTSESHKKISQLSKGFRQRVGLANALLHNPDVLILDEPTTGLDPNQLVEIRKLIKQLGKEKTVILSTHIMQEVEAVCDQVVIINKGLIVANDETKNLQAAALQQVTYVVEFDQVIQKQDLLKIEGVIAAQGLADKSWVLQTNTLVDVRKNIFDFAVKNNLVLLSIQKEEEKLEDIFRKLTAN